MSAKANRVQHEEGLTGAERMVRPLELFTRSKVLALGSDALEVIRVVLEAVHGIKCGCTLCRRGLCVPMLGLVCLGEPGYDGRCQGAGAGLFRKMLAIKTSGLEDVFAGENREISSGKGGKGGKDLRGEVRVGHCRSVFATENQAVETIGQLSPDPHHGRPQS